MDENDNERIILYSNDLSRNDEEPINDCDEYLESKVKQSKAKYFIMLIKKYFMKIKLNKKGD